MISQQQDTKLCISRVAGRQPLSWLLAASGYGPLGYARQLISAGRITINDTCMTNIHSRADPTHDMLYLDHKIVSYGPFCRYIAIYKPYNVVCAFTDPEGRPSLADYVPIVGIDAAGRLDYDSEGLLILTNDGWLSHRLTHPNYEHPKTYLVQVEGVPDERALEALRAGVVIKSQTTRPAQVDMLTEPIVAPRTTPIQYRHNVPTAWLQVVLREGRKRQLRHMTAAVDCPTLRLIRIAIGPVHLAGLEPGAWRDLCEEEMQALSYIPRLLRQRSK